VKLETEPAKLCVTVGRASPEVRRLPSKVLSVKPDGLYYVVRLNIVVPRS
jgi:hypothetical protein